MQVVTFPTGGRHLSHGHTLTHQHKELSRRAHLLLEAAAVGAPLLAEAEEETN